jgi:spermidine synthase
MARITEPDAVRMARVHPLLLLLFVGSGCSALIYEIVWFQLLELVIGSSAISLGVLLATFMGGMCLGSLLLPRHVSSRHHPLRVYAILEIGIGLIALLVLFGLPVAGRIYTPNAGHGMVSFALRSLISALFLLPPTLLMGATLPAIARWIETTPKGVSWLGLFYAGNITGAVIGCLLAGFYLLRVHDMLIATLVAVTINALVAAAGLGLAARTSYQPSDEREAVGAGGERAPGAWPVYLVIGLSGLTALGAEVVWTRILSLMLGASVYTFSIILAVFLTGLGAGSSAGSYMARSLNRPRLALGVCQMLLVAAIGWTAWMLADSLPFWPINPALATSPWLNFQLDLMRCTWAVLPAAVLWGASFPLALAACARPGQDPGRLVGGVYAANTIGAIAGAILFSVVFVPALGTQGAQRVMIGLAVVSALLVLAPSLRGSPDDGARRVKLHPAGAAALLACALLAVLVGRAVPPIPGGLVAYGRFLPTKEFVPNILEMSEGMNASIAVSELSNGVRNFHVSGKIEASTESYDMRLQRMLGHLSALLHPAPRSVLIVGFGAGVTAGTFVLHPGIERIVICEIEPEIPRVVAKYFAEQNYDVLNDPRVEVVYDDARHFVLTTKEKFDVITSDPIHPWVKGAATLYTKEYFELAKQHLNPGGVITQWVPLYESTPAVVKSEMATFFDVFPEGLVWSNDIDGWGYDVVLFGQAQPSPIDIDALQARTQRPEYRAVTSSLGEVGFWSMADLLSTYAGRGPDLAPWVEGAAINTDRNLRLQYLAGMGLNLQEGSNIFNDILLYRSLPEGVFTGSEESVRALWDILAPGTLR